MAFKRSVYQGLMARIDIIDVISKYVPLAKRSPGNAYEYIALCPFHKEKTPSFTVTRMKQFYHCLGCGNNGNAVTFLQKFCGLPGGEALVEAAKICGIRVPQGPSTPNPKKLRDRKKHKRKMEHRQRVVWNEERKTRRAAYQARLAKSPVAVSLFDDTEDDLILF